MDILINDIEARIVGSLMEKALSTPEYYPLSLNALTNACNQKSSRDPVVSYDESAVQATADHLDEGGLVNRMNSGRAIKYEERLSQKHSLLPKESAALCVLLLRGPQTAGEIRNRTSRMYRFDTLDELQETMANLQEWGFVRRLERLAGHKECRYVHLLCGAPDSPDKDDLCVEQVAETPVSCDRIEALESTVASLRSEIEDLKKDLHAFKEQFE